ncbi:MAG: protein arginine kinase [Planctomycetaceae bacterium]|nr:protein arginine kinase [Planctomycetaceae bacterium]MCB9949660.1 protein arginine kinase [Planctomycetaceae bacterium]
MELDDLIGGCGEWLRGTGPESDVVISSRIRLARNLTDMTFPPRADERTKEDAANLLREKILELSPVAFMGYVEVQGLSKLDRQFLMERQLISRELADAKGARGVFIGTSESISLMVNEEDHLRLQGLRSGFDLMNCWQEVNHVDDELQTGISFAFSDDFGYLTSCPTNVGTGIRVSVMLHLPALVLTKEIQKVFQAMHKMSIAVRGMYGEGSQALGDFYQISNQTTLGKTEEQIVQRVQHVIPEILGYERDARQELLRKHRARLHDQVSRAQGILGSARQISTEEAMQHLSHVRLGINLELLDNIDLGTVNELVMLIQPAHLQKLRHESLDKPERDAARSALLRDKLRLN